MFEIYNGHDKFTQWTKDQKLIMNDLPVGTKVFFYSDPATDDPLITEVYEMRDDARRMIKVCNVPNILLTDTNKIRVRIPNTIVARYGVHYKYAGPHAKIFEVEEAEQPSDYVYEETETEGAGNASSTGDSTFVVTFTPGLDDDGYPGIKSADKTIDEILDAVYEGKHVTAVIADSYDNISENTFLQLSYTYSPLRRNTREFDPNAPIGRHIQFTAIGKNLYEDNIRVEIIAYHEEVDYNSSTNTYDVTAKITYTRGECALNT